MQNSFDWNLYPESILTVLKSSQKKVTLSKVNRNLPKFIFLCGKDISTQNSNREVVTNFYKKIRHDVICIYSEKLWEVLKFSKMELLTFEEFLAELSDGIILFLESYGTACELGAFAMKETLLKKMLIFNDKSFKKISSFINDGPIQKVTDRNNENVVFTDMNALLSNPLVSVKLRNFAPIIKDCKVNKDPNSIKLNSFIIELLELISLFQPIKSNDLIFIYKYIKGFTTFDYYGGSDNRTIKNISTTQIIDLLKFLKLVNIDKYNNIRLEHTEFEFNNFMLNISPSQFNKYRSIILAKKYHHKQEGVCA